MKEHNINNTQNHDTRYNVVHPQCRGYVHRTVFYSIFLQKPQFWSAHLATDPFSPQSRAHSCRPLRTQLQIFLSSKTLCAHSCRGRPRTQLGLNLFLQNSLSFTLIPLTQNPNLTSLQECIFIQRTYYKTMGLNHGHQKPQTLDLNHGFITKRGLWLNPNTPKTILSHTNSTKKPRSYQN